MSFSNNPYDAGLKGLVNPTNIFAQNPGASTGIGTKGVYVFPSTGNSSTPITHYMRLGLLEFRDRTTFTYNEGPSDNANANTAKVNNMAAIYLPIPDNLTSNITPMWDMVDLDYMGLLLHSLDGKVAESLKTIGGKIANGTATKEDFETAWDDTSGLGVGLGSKLAAHILNETARGIGLNETADALSLGMKTAFNPFKEAIFRGVGNRVFQFTWNLFPKTKEECDEIQDIIKILKYHSVPELTASTSMFEYPGEFTLEFYSNGVENQYLPKIGYCVCNGVDTNSTPSGIWTALQNGHPVDINLTLSFTETEIVTKEKIKDGY